MKYLHLLKAGSFTDLNSQQVNFSAADIEAIAKAYDPAIHEVPLVVGHPKSDDPAFGWVASMSADESGLHGQPHQVDTAFAEMVRGHKFKKISLALYGPQHPSNPVPGGWYPKHVGFLGAQAPAVKGLRNAELGEPDVNDQAHTLTIELSETDLHTPTHNKMRTPAMTEAEKAAQVAQQQAQQQLNDDTVALAEQTTAMEAREAKLKASEIEFAEQQAQIATAAITDRVDGYVADRRIGKQHREGFIALAQLAGKTTDITIELAEDGGKQPLAKWLWGFLDTLPAEVSFQEVSGAPSSAAKKQSLTNTQISNQAVAFVEENKAKGITVTQVEAVDHIRSQHTQAGA